jgi:UDP-N-acetylmuramoyl-tripeptide--D-alanyl-D-alanine ligase
MKSIDIYKNIKSIKIYNEIDSLINNVTIDTRELNAGDCYIGVKGEKFDGNTFYKEAFDKGANICILDNYEINDKDLKYLKENNKSIMVVENSVIALGNLARYVRNKFNYPVIAITGSSGKTSTKDLIHSVLKMKYNAHKTPGNKNNFTGLPTSLLSINDNTNMLILEMGMNHLGEISYLTNIVNPDVAVITNVGTAHIGNLGSRENILKAKLEILEGLKKNGIVVINNDNDLLHSWYLKNKNKYNIITIGIDNKSDYQATDIKEHEDKSEFKVNG